MFLLKLDGVQ